MSTLALKGWENVDICTVRKEAVVDIKDIKIDSSKSREERMVDYIKQVKNPYCFRCDGIIVKMSFSQSKESLEDKLASYFMSL